MTKIVIVGGGTAGWMTAAWLIKKNKNISITLIESPDIPKIGVGESVTPHVANFFMGLGVPEEHWMYHTGAIYKLANKFVNWKTNTGEAEYFSFNYTSDSQLFYKENSVPLTVNDWQIKNLRSSDVLLDLCNQGKINKFGDYFHTQYHYMEQNRAPFINNDYLLNPLLSWSHHINAELTAEYIRDHIAVPSGVTHIKTKVVDANAQGENITSVILEDGRVIEGDVFVDCTGFRRLLANKLGWKVKEYNNAAVNRAWVCQIDYNDREKEMVNYSQTIAQPHGWMFRISLYHRMGTGYIFSSNHTTEENAREYFLDQIGDMDRRFDPKLIKWTPSRLEHAAKGNTVAIGLSFGFVEPMEANALYTIITTIGKLSEALNNNLDFTLLNKNVCYSMDDIADFAMVHYSLSQRTGTDFWSDMRSRNVNNSHIDLLYSKYTSPMHSMSSCIDGTTLFPDYMWAHLAQAWGVDTSSWNIKADKVTQDLAKLYYEYQYSKHKSASGMCDNNYVWLKKNRFKDLNSQEWERLIRS